MKPENYIGTSQIQEGWERRSRQPVLRPRGEKDHNLPTGQTEVLLMEPSTREEILTPQEVSQLKGHKELDLTEHTHAHKLLY